MEQGLPLNSVNVVFVDHAGTLWLGTHKGLTRKDGNKFVTLTTEDGLSNNDVRNISEDHNGNLWVGTFSSGANRYAKGKFEIFDTKRRGLSNDQIRAFYEDKDGVMWIATAGGLNRLKDNKISSFTVKDGMLQDDISTILEDDDNNLWMSSVRGVFRVSKQALADFADGKRGERLSFVSYGVSDGMNTTECNGGGIAARGLARTRWPHVVSHDEGRSGGRSKEGEPWCCRPAVVMESAKHRRMSMSIRALSSKRLRASKISNSATQRPIFFRRKKPLSDTSWKAMTRDWVDAGHAAYRFLPKYSRASVCFSRGSPNGSGGS